MKVQDFLDIKGDNWGIKYYNSIHHEYEPNLQDGIVSVKFFKNGESGEYQVYTDSVKNCNVDNMSIGEIKKYCTDTVDCRKCGIKEFCEKSFGLMPRKW